MMKPEMLKWIRGLILTGILLLFAPSAQAAEMVVLPRSQETAIGAQRAVRESSTEKLVPVYRLYNQSNGEHLYTTDAHERMVLWTKYGWVYEGIGWYAKKSGDPVYRLYQPGLDNHLYTTDRNEVRVLTESYGWQADNGGEALFHSAGDVPIYRLYNRNQSGMHLITTDHNEYQTLPSYGWKQEGFKIHAAAAGASIPTYTAFNEMNYSTQDAKIGFDQNIITSQDGRLTLIDRNSGKRTQTSVPSNWISVLQNERIVAVSSGEKSTHIVRFNSAGKIVRDDQIFSASDGLRIDPSILKFNGQYYLSSTRIDGTVNSKDPTEKNGHYTVELYRSKDLLTWNKVSTIVEADSNLEDPDLIAIDGKLCLVYEEETRDQMASTIKICLSDDGGVTFGESVSLVSGGADNEPAVFSEDESIYLLFYSSDLANLGKSYSGASIYLSEFDQSYELLRTKLIPSSPQSGLLLYDVEADDQGFLFLFAEDYSGKNQLRLQYLSRNEVLN